MIERHLKLLCQLFLTGVCGFIVLCEYRFFIMFVSMFNKSDGAVYFSFFQFSQLLFDLLPPVTLFFLFFQMKKVQIKELKFSPYSFLIADWKLENTEALTLSGHLI